MSSTVGEVEKVEEEKAEGVGLLFPSLQIIMDHPHPVDAIIRDLGLFFAGRPTPDSCEEFYNYSFQPMSICHSCEKAGADCQIKYNRPGQVSCERCYNKKIPNCNVERWILLRLMWLIGRMLEGRGYPVEHDLPIEVPAGDAVLHRDANGHITWTYTPRDPHDARMPFTIPH